MKSERFTESWWLMYCSFPDLEWARLRVFHSGNAEVLDSDAATHQFKTEYEAVNWLREDEFLAFSSVSAEDEAEYGIDLSKIMPPAGRSDEQLLGKMHVSAKSA